MVPEDETARENIERAAFIHREIVQLIGLMLVAVVAFFVTRAVAASNREMSLQDAAEWYRRGQAALTSGRIDTAVEAFRRAAVRNRTNKQYMLALARALARNEDDDAARSVLLTLRELSPDDTEINLELARLAAGRDDVTEALRYYHNALYAPWRPELADARRQVRLELIRFLLTHNQASRALSELFAVSADLPDRASAHVEVGQLFVKAGDYQRGLEQFQRALQLAPDDGAALAGAGESAFYLGRYTVARTYLRRAPPEVGDVSSQREIVERVLVDDPLAARIGSGERRRRLTSDLAYVRDRLATCTTGSGNVPASEDDLALQHESSTFTEQLKPSTPLDQDTIEAGVDLVDRIAQRLLKACSSPTARDRALTLIGREHGGSK